MPPYGHCSAKRTHFFEQGLFQHIFACARALPLFHLVLVAHSLPHLHRALFAYTHFVLPQKQCIRSRPDVHPRFRRLCRRRIRWAAVHAMANGDIGAILSHSKFRFVYITQVYVSFTIFMQGECSWHVSRSQLDPLQGNGSGHGMDASESE